MLGALVLAGIAGAMVLPDFVAASKGEPDDEGTADADQATELDGGDLLDSAVPPRAAAAAALAVEVNAPTDAGEAETDDRARAVNSGGQTPILSGEEGPGDFEAGATDADVPENSDPGGDDREDEPPSDEQRSTDTDTPDTNPWREPLFVDVASGLHVIENFDPDEDTLVLNLPDSASGLTLTDATDDTDATLGWRQDDGTVGLLFDLVGVVPVDAIEVQFSGLDYTVSLSEVLDMQVNGPASVTDPEEESVPPEGDAVDGPALAAEDREAPAEPPRPGPEPETILTPEEDTDPLDIGPQDSGPIATDPAPSEPDADDAQRVEGFVPGEDILQVQTDASGALSVVTDTEAGETQIFVGDTLVAILTDTAGVTENDVVVGRLPTIRAA